MAKRGGFEIGKLNSVFFTPAAAASGTPAGHNAAGCSASFYPVTDARGSSGGFFNFAAMGTFTATVIVEVTFDDGVTWIAANDDAGNAFSATAGKWQRARQLENGVAYRMKCSAFTSAGAGAAFRLSQ